MATRGTRHIGGQEYLLAGRGSKEECRAQVPTLRKTWRLVRVVPMGPVGRLVDDFGVYVHDATPGQQQCPEWTWEGRCAGAAGHMGPHECAAALERKAGR